eukprot:608973-Ditylum_brightwellii.AAC.1
MTRKQLRSFTGIINYYCDMWQGCSKVLVLLVVLTSTVTPWNWISVEKKAFDCARKIVSQEMLLVYQDFNISFEIHTDASDAQLGVVISQWGMPIAFYSCKLNSVQKNYTTMERELLDTVETLKELKNILLGQQIKIYTDHKKPNI